MTEIQRTNPGALMSDAVVHGGLAYLSGQVAWDAAGQGVEAETDEVLARIDRLLQAAGTDRSRLLQATIWLADLADGAAVNAIWSRWIPEGAAPARATVRADLIKDFRIEVMVVAATA